MWLYILLLVLGVVALCAGITSAKHTKSKRWHILTAFGAVAVLGGIVLILSTALLLGGIASDSPEEQHPDSIEEEPIDDDTDGLVGGDWRTYRGYSQDFLITDWFSICFSTLDDSNGYSVYDASNGDRIGTILFEEGESLAEQEWISQLEDHNGDGANDLGILLEDGTTVWYLYDDTLLYKWPETVCGCFPREVIEEDPAGFPKSFEPVNARESLTEAQKVLYDEMCPKILALEPFSYDAASYGYDTLDDVLIAWGAIALDHVEIDNYFAIEEVFDENGTTTSLDAQYACKWLSSESADLYQVRAGIAEFDAATADILAGLRDDMTTRERYLYLAQAVSLRTEYDYDSESVAAAAPWGGIVGGVSICQGYAHAYAYLCQQADLWCRIVSGASGDESHAWNLIWLPSGTYHVDITWADDRTDEMWSKDWVQYFAMTQEQAEAEHTITDGTVATGT